jgi:RNA polymerase sigma factor (sigma-70 family)
MSGGAHGRVLREIQRLFRGGTASGLTEWQLLRRYVAEGDASAFEVLLSRHGPMVLGVCRRMLDDPTDVEDAFQATFLVLVRRAGALREHDVLGLWLYGVAFRVALRARSASSLRRRRERPGVEFVPEPAADAEDPCQRDLAAVLDEECRRLPTKYYAPLVLCYLEGRTYGEAAQQLGWPVATVKGRLSRARDLLRTRLARRGLAPSDALLAASISRDAKSAVPEPLVNSTVRSALEFFTGLSTNPAVSTTATSIAEGVLMSMVLNRTIVAAGLLTVGLIAACVAGLAPRFATGGPPETDQDKKKEPAPARTTTAGTDVRRPDSPNIARRRDAATDRRTEAILDKLDVPVAVHFPKETTLREFLDFVRLQTKSEDIPNGIPIYLDPVALGEAEKTIDSPITIDLEGVLLRITIRLALQQLGLDYRVKDGVLAIFCSASEDSPSLYSDLLNKSERGDLTPEEADQYTQILETLIKVKKLEVELQRLEAEEASLLHQAEFPGAKIRDSPKPVGDPHQ